MVPKVGDILFVGKRASVQFAGDRQITFRVTGLPGWVTYDGWIWLSGYTLDDKFEALDKRTIFVQKAGLQAISLWSGKPKSIQIKKRPGKPPAPPPLDESLENTVISDSIENRRRGRVTPKLF